MTLSLILAAADTSAWTPLWAAAVGGGIALTGILINNAFQFKNVRDQRAVDEQRRKEEMAEREYIFWRNEILQLGYDYVQAVDELIDGLIVEDEDRCMTVLSRIHSLSSKGMLIVPQDTYEVMADSTNRLSSLVGGAFIDIDRMWESSLWLELADKHPSMMDNPFQREKLLNQRIKNTPPQARTDVINAIRHAVSLDRQDGKEDR